VETIDESIEVARLFQEVMHLFKHSMTRLLDDTGMSAPQGMVVGLLSRKKKMKITELSNELCLSNSTVSGIIDRLEKQGMVERERSEKDKRVVYVSISPDFKVGHEVFHKKLEKNIENILSQGNPEELHTIFEGLDALKKLLKDQQNKTVTMNGDDVND
jgi:MarR family transcriptional regulator, organic hydroperoxide resistance regulator